MRVWVVDDHHSAAVAIAETAQSLGYNARCFASAEASLSALNTEESPQVLLTDLRLPGIDGVSLLEKFKVLSPHTEAIVVTAYGSIEEAVRAIRVGGLDFLSKPLSVEKVEAALRNAVERFTLCAELRRLQDLLYHTNARLAVLSPQAKLTTSHKAPLIAGLSLPQGDIDLPVFLDEIEREMIQRALIRNNGNKTQTARSLGLSRETLRYKLQKLSIDGGSDE